MEKWQKHFKDQLTLRWVAESAGRFRRAVRDHLHRHILSRQQKTLHTFSGNSLRFHLLSGSYKRGGECYETLIFEVE